MIDKSVTIHCPGCGAQIQVPVDIESIKPAISGTGYTFIDVTFNPSRVDHACSTT